MEVTLPDETHPVRVEVRSFLDEHPDPDPADLAAACLVAPGWPEPWGRSADILEVELEFKKGLESVSWPGRFETISNDPLVVIDGAHNPSAARALVKTLKEAYPKHRIGFIFGFLEDKDSIEFVRILKPLVSKVWAVSIDAPRGTTAEQTAAQIWAAGLEVTSADISAVWNQARDWAVAEPDRMVVITGSLYLKQMLANSGCI